MGYSTEFKGVLNFNTELTASQLAYLAKFLGKDRRDLGIFDDEAYAKADYGDYWYHFDLELTDSFDGVKWNQAEKTDNMEGIVNFLIDKMQEVCPGFTFEGTLYAQGEDCEDRWELRMVNGRAVRIDVPILGQKINCPLCGGTFILDNSE